MRFLFFHQIGHIQYSFTRNNLVALDSIGTVLQIFTYSKRFLSHVVDNRTLFSNVDHMLHVICQVCIREHH